MSRNSSAAGQIAPWKHKKYTHKWVEANLDKTEANTEQLIKDIVALGSRRRLGMRYCHLQKVKADQRKAEREKLATTSLKDIIH